MGVALERLGDVISDAHALIAALLGDCVELLLEGSSQGRETEYVYGYSILRAKVRGREGIDMLKLSLTLSRRPVQRG